MQAPWLDPHGEPAKLFELGILQRIGCDENVSMPSKTCLALLYAWYLSLSHDHHSPLLKQNNIKLYKKAVAQTTQFIVLQFEKQKKNVVCK